MIRLRWPDGFRCPHCGSDKKWEKDSGLLRCCKCKADISVTSGTIFHNSHIPLKVWFRAMWGITSQKSGISAISLQNTLGIGSYRTAWACLHRLRRAMIRPGREPLARKVEVDEIYVGGVEKGKGKRNLGETKTLVAVAVEAKGRRGIGRIRLQPIPDASQKNLLGFVKEVVEPGAVVITDGWPGYSGLNNIGYEHRPRVALNNTKSASALLPRVHRVSALLKRWLLGIHQGRVSRGQMGYYLDEFVFRFNRRRSLHRGKLFYRLVQQAIATKPVSYSYLTRKKSS